MRAASIDIGSNSILLLIAERSGTGWRRVEEYVEVARISEGLDATGILQPAGIERARVVLARFRLQMDAAGVEHRVATGTAPFRRARNGEQVARELGELLGTPIDVVSGEQEAHLNRLAIQQSFPELTDALLVDIGGASTELIRLRPGQSDAELQSLDIGAVRLSERVGLQAPMSAAQRAALDTVIADALAMPGLQRLVTPTPAAVVGSAGTVTTLFALHLQLREWDAERVQGGFLPADSLGELVEKIAALDLEARRDLPGMAPGREDVIPAGGLLLGAILRRSQADGLLVNDRSLRWGRLYQVFGDG